MSGLDKFKELDAIPLPKTKKRQRSASKGSGNKQKKNKVKEDKNNNSFLPISSKSKVQASVTKPVAKKSPQLSRTNLELKYDSPDKSLLKNISITDETKFEHPVEEKKVPVGKFSPTIDPDSDDFALLNRDVGSVEGPEMLNTKILNTIQSYTSPSDKRYAPAGSLSCDMKQLLDENKAETVNYLQKSLKGEAIENERKIQVKTVTAVSDTELLVDFKFVGDSGELIDDGKENVMSLCARFYEEILLKTQNLIIKSSHSIELKDNVVMHFISHLRAC